MHATAHLFGAMIILLHIEWKWRFNSECWLDLCSCCMYVNGMYQQMLEWIWCCTGCCEWIPLFSVRCWANAILKQGGTRIKLVSSVCLKISTSSSYFKDCTSVHCFLYSNTLDHIKSPIHEHFKKQIIEWSCCFDSSIFIVLFTTLLFHITLVIYMPIWASS